MDSLFVILIPLLLLAVLLGCLFGWLSFFKIRALQAQLDQLRSELNRINVRPTESAKLERGDAGRPNPAQPQPEPNAVAADREPTEDDPGISSEAVFPDEEPNLLVDHLKHHWMIWLGGICVGLAGVFMVKYSIERGLLGPTARVMLAILTGLGLHSGAEWLRRRQGAHPSFAALAGGASLILYSALLAAMQLYQLISPVVAFTLLAVISLLTMVLAIRHGPMLAMLGLLGAYVVPLLVSTGSGDINAALIYSAIISAAALWLMRFIYRPWLLIGMLAGALGWWAVSLLADMADGWRGPYIAILAYLLLAAPRADFWLRQPQRINSTHPSFPDTGFGRSLSDAPFALIVLILVIAQAASIYVERLLPLTFFTWAPFTAILFLAARSRDRMVWLPWAALLLQLVTWYLVAWDEAGFTRWPINLDPPIQAAFLKMAAWSTSLHVLFAAWNLRAGRHIAVWSSLLLLSPLLWLALGYVLTRHVENSWYWTAYTVVIGLLYGAWASFRLARGGDNSFTVWLILGAYLAYALAAAFMLRQAGLTLVLATQIVSLAFVIQRFSQPGLVLLMKVVLAIVVARLSLNPWLVDYPVDSHWSLWLYGGSTLCCAVGAWRLHDHPALGKWLELATLHLGVLTIWSETRYWLYDGNLFDLRYGFAEAAINTSLWSALSIIYRWRGQLSLQLAKIYTLVADGLMLLSMASYLLLLTVLNPLWNPDQVGATPVFNILLLAYGLPVIMFLMLARTVPRRYRSFSFGLSAVAAFVFVNIEIHHIWNGSTSLAQAIGDGELYTYSAVWLVLAVVIILIGQTRSFVAYRAGIGLLGLVIAKIFVIDMAGLEGLLRVASFMGLGLSLLGIAFLLQRNRSSTAAEVTVTPG